MKTCLSLLFLFFIVPVATGFTLGPAAPSHPCFSGNMVIGAILQKYDALGACNGFLGRPLTRELPTPDGRGRYNRFQGGWILWTPKTGAHEVHGAILEHWLKPGVSTQLGYPISDELVGVRNSRYSKFEGGIIRWTPNQGAKTVLSNTATANPPRQPRPQTSYNDLVVYFRGETAGNKLYVRNRSSKRVQAKPLQLIEGKKAAHFTLSPNGGSYEVLRDACGKADCLEPVLERVTYVRLRRGEDKVLRF